MEVEPVDRRRLLCSSPSTSSCTEALSHSTMEGCNTYQENIDPTAFLGPRQRLRTRRSAEDLQALRQGRQSSGLDAQCIKIVRQEENERLNEISVTKFKKQLTRKGLDDRRQGQLNQLIERHQAQSLRNNSGQLDLDFLQLDRNDSLRIFEELEHKKNEERHPSERWHDSMSMKINAWCVNIV